MQTSRSLSTCLEDLEKKARGYRTEADLRQDFIECLNAFLHGQGLPDKGVSVALERREVTGRSDARIGSIVMELKLPTPQGKGIEAAVDDARRRIEGERKRGRPVWAVAYDGLSMTLLDGEGNEYRRGRPHNVAPLLEAWLVSLGSHVTTVEQFVERLGQGSPVAKTLFDILWRLFKGYREKVGFVQEVYEVWEALYGVTTNITAEAREGLRRSARTAGLTIGAREVEHYLFVVQTYLALLLKLLVARVACQQRMTDEALVQRLITQNGDHFLGLRDLERRVPRVQGILEEDVFLWPGDAATAATDDERRLLNEGIRLLADAVDDVDLVGAQADFLRLVYERFVDPVTRRSLGQFYTNPNLVNETLDAAGYRGGLDEKIADISCGSGTFLMEAIQRILKKNSNEAPERLLTAITENVIGVDIYPFAVAMARVNYLIAIAPLLPAQVTVSIPIYWADSLTRLRGRPTERERPLTGVRPITVPVAGLGTFTLPHPDDVDWDQLLQLVRDVVVDVGRWQRDIDPATAVQRFWEQAPSSWKQGYEETIGGFVKAIVERHNSNRDTRWLPLLRNALAVERLGGSCHYVVGNPPWVRIHNIEPALRQRLFRDYDVCRDAGWKFGARLGGAGRGFGRQVDYSVPFVERALEFLRPGGKLAYVITSKWMHALYGNALRKALLERTRLDTLVDYSLCATPLFEDATNYPLVLVASRRAPDKGDKVAVQVVGPQGSRMTMALEQGELPVLDGDPEAPWALVSPAVRAALRKMARSPSGGFRTLLGQTESSRPGRGVLTSLNDVFIVKEAWPVAEDPDEVTVRTEGYFRKTTSAGEKASYEARLEKRLLRPLVRGANIQAWSYTVNHRILWTHDDATGKALEDLPPKAKAYFQRHEARLRRRDDYEDDMPAWAIFRVSPDKLGDKVAWQELSDVLGAVYIPARVSDNQVGEAPLIPIQTAYFVPAPSDAAGYAFAAVLNSLPARMYASSFAESARGAYHRYFSWVLGILPLPDEVRLLLSVRGSRVLPSLQRLLEVSRSLHADPDRPDREALEREVDAEVARLYGLDDADMRALRDFYAFIRANPSGKPSSPPEQESDAEPDEV
ncbi:MAG: N-6 DNA methylase [Chloroflexota bacterium]|nr:N-6 DNA methylase [Chloroflexota bacterium]